MRVKGVKTSKRTSLKLKNNVQKRVNHTRRKARKLAKEARKQGVIQSKARKTVQIPNMWPNKAELLAEIEEKKERREAETEAEKERVRKQQRKKLTMEAMTRDADKRAKSFLKTHGVLPNDIQAMEAKSQDAENSRKSFYRMLRTVIHQADVVVQVLDARDPNSCRCPELEQEILSQGKRLILLLNKIDLVPKESVFAWLEHLRKYFPTMAFKAAREKGVIKHANTSLENASEGLLRSGVGVVGADTLMQLLKNYARSENRKTAISVGIVGYPNVGKSSVINSMKRTAATRTGATAGVTRHVQEVQLDSKVKLLDTPGVVFSGASEDASVVMRNATKVEALKDPVKVVGALLTRAPKEALMRHFQLPSFYDATDFLILVAKARGKVKRGGALDLISAARHVLSEWATGKIRYYCMPPTKEEGAEASIVTNYAQEFDVEALFKEEANVLATLASDNSAMCMSSSATNTIQVMNLEEDGDEEMEGSESESGSDESGDSDSDDEDCPMLVAESLPAKSKRGDEKLDTKKMFNVNNPRINKQKKMAAKASKKNKKGQAYSFKRDFKMQD